MSKVAPIKERKYGWLPDVPSAKDYPFRSLRAIPRLNPPSANLSSFVPYVHDQSNLGSCAPQSITEQLELLRVKNKVPRPACSPMFEYYNTRVLQDTVNFDSGCYIRTTIKAAAQFGICSEVSWPYIIPKFTIKPPISAYTEAEDNQILQYFRLTTGSLAEMKTCLADGYAFSFGFSVYDYFQSAKMAQTGILYLPRPKEKLLGGHAVLAVGYNEKQRRFLILNSWGKGWGLPKMPGFFTMPYEYITNPDYADDFWTIRTAENA